MKQSRQQAVTCTVPGNCPARLTTLSFAVAFGIASQPALAESDPPFSATADTVFDIIQDDDPSTFICLHYEGRDIRQMWDKREDDEFNHNVFIFSAHFTDMPPFEIVLNPEFETPEAARSEADRYGHRVGQIPLVFRHGIRRLGIHKGDEGFHAGTGKIFVYSEMSDRRISQKRLTESLLHESIHATLDHEYRLSPEWVAAQREDGAFMTRYARSRPEREDLAETALFAYALLRHPGRIPPVDSRDILARVPTRIAFIEEILNTEPDIPAVPAPPDGCT